MKILRYLFIFSLLMAFAISCDKGIDPITPIAPGNDETAPVIAISYPIDGKIVKSTDTIATITFELLAEDDIELQSVKIQLDGTEIGAITSFTDYRRAVIDYVYNTLTDGDHVLTVTATDLTGKSTTTSISFKKITAQPYTALDGEVLYLAFDDNLLDNISGTEATVVGSPGFAAGKTFGAYAGAADSYLTFPSAGLVGDEFSVCFWYKINATPLRAGIMAISAVGDSRNTGFRFLRENNGDNQNLGINFGIGATEVWMNPFTTVPPTQDWMHMAITISKTHATIYVNGDIVKETDIESKIDWTDCTSMTLGSGAPNFTYWEHFSDLSLYDELHIFKRAITAEEVNHFYTMK
jgi:hypothetical protein